MGWCGSGSEGEERVTEKGGCWAFFFVANGVEMRLWAGDVDVKSLFGSKT